MTMTGISNVLGADDSTGGLNTPHSNDPTLLPLATGGDERTAELHQQAKQQSDQADSEFTIGILRRALEASTKELEESRMQLNQ